VGQPKLTMKVVDVVPSDRSCTISVEIKHGEDVWHKGFTIPAEALPAFTLDDLRKRVMDEAHDLIRKKRMKDQAVASLQGLLDKEIPLSQTPVESPA
jgi:hypothetical protein